MGRGDEHIRATHPKTLELTPDETITERATCVIAVGAGFDPPTPMAMAGPVRITIDAGDESFAFDAQANPSWDPLGPAVIRRSPLRLPGTLATHASASAAELPRALVEASRSTETTVVVTLESVPSHACLVLFAADPSTLNDPRMAAELAVADVVVAEDAAARRLVGRTNRAPSALEGRVLVVATSDLPGTSVPRKPCESVATFAVETVGLSARLAVAAASASRAPLVLVPDGADPREALRTTPAGHRVVLAVEHARLPAVLALAAELRGSADAVLAQEYAPPVRAVHGCALPELPSKDIVYCCLEPADAGADAALDPAVRLAIAALLEDGVATKTAARALAELTGWPRRQAYDLLVTWRAAGTGNTLES